jgi:hypothetical protein
MKMARLIVEELEEKDLNKPNMIEATNPKSGIQTLLEMKDEDDDTSLLLACKLENDGIAQLLIDKGSNVNAIYKQGKCTASCF